MMDNWEKRIPHNTNARPEQDTKHAVEKIPIPEDLIETIFATILEDKDITGISEQNLVILQTNFSQWLRARTIGILGGESGTHLELRKLKSKNGNKDLYVFDFDYTDMVKEVFQAMLDYPSEFGIEYQNGETNRMRELLHAFVNSIEQGFPITEIEPSWEVGEIVTVRNNVPSTMTDILIPESLYRIVKINSENNSQTLLELQPIKRQPVSVPRSDSLPEDTFDDSSRKTFTISDAWVIPIKH